MNKGSRSIFTEGLRDGVPIAAGYFAVAFSLGITARASGFTAFQGFAASLLTYASAGEYIGFTLYAANATLFQLIVMTVITNARYFLMGLALNQRLPEGSSIGTRLLTGVPITDEIFGITIARPGYVNPIYSLGALAIAAPMWALGTALGITMGNILPGQLVSALSVALFGMFLAVIIPAGRKDRKVAAVIIASFAAGYGIRFLPGLGRLSSGNRTIVLTLVISSAAALLFPVPDDTEEGKEADAL